MNTDTLTDLGNLIIGRDTSTLVKIAATAIILVAAWVIDKLINRYILRRIVDPKSQYWARKAKGYVIVTVAFLAIWWVWIAGLRSVATFLGLLLAGIAIALREPLSNVAGWLFIITRRPFKIGDRIQVGEHIGDVADLRVFQFSLLEIQSWVDADQMTGRVIHIPNGWIFQKAQINYAAALNYIFDEIPVLVTFESNWEKAKAILFDIVQEHSMPHEEIERVQSRIATSDFLVEHYGLEGAVYTSVEDSGVMLTMRYICDPRQRRQVAEDMWESVLRRFARHPDVDLAYPTTRFYTMDGKQATTAAPPRPGVQVTRTPRD